MSDIFADLALSPVSKPAILVNRFIINLRTADDSSQATIPSLHIPSALLRVSQSFLGNIGEPLEFGHLGSINEDDSANEAELPAEAVAYIVMEQLYSTERAKHVEKMVWLPQNKDLNH